MVRIKSVIGFKSVWGKMGKKVFLTKDVNFEFESSVIKGHPEFFLNKSALKDESGNDFSKEDFKYRIKEEVLKFMDRSFSNIVLLVGAGASIITQNGNIDPNYGKTVAMIAQTVYEKLSNNRYLFSGDTNETNVYDLDTLANRINYEHCKVGEDGKLKKEFQLEEFLSQLVSFQQFITDPQEKEKTKASFEAILDIIKASTNYSYQSNVFKHAALLNILSKKLGNEQKLVVATTNYDTLLEEAAESINFTIIDGFSFSSKPVFDSSMFDWHFVKQVPYIKTNQNIYKQNVIDLLKIHGSLTWKEDSDNSIIRKEKDKIKKPVMIFPSTNKYAQSYRPPFFELFTKFQESLRKPNTLLITTGFSFADNHISSMIEQAIKTNETLSVLISDFNINIEDLNANMQALQSLMKQQFPIAFLKATLNDDLNDYLG